MNIGNESLLKMNIANGALWDYCDCCGKRIEVGDKCYDVTDGRTFCLDCIDLNKCAGAEEDGDGNG